MRARARVPRKSLPARLRRYAAIRANGEQCGEAHAEVRECPSSDLVEDEGGGDEQAHEGAADDEASGEEADAYGIVDSVLQLARQPEGRQSEESWREADEEGRCEDGEEGAGHELGCMVSELREWHSTTGE